MSAREAMAGAGYEALARADFGSRIAYYRARPTDAAADEVLLQLVLPAAERAARAVARLDHPSVLRLVGIRHAPGYRVLLFEPFRGRSLGREIERAGRLEARRALHLGAALARGLAHAHAIGVAHGDLSLENVALGPRGEVKLLGFGAIEGTPDGDVVDLARTLWRAAAGDAPLESGPAQGDLAVLKRLLERCLRLRPELGFYPDAAALASALESAERRLGEAKADMTGRFSPAELAGLLQMIELNRRSGRLELAPSDGGHAGAIAFREGKIIGARAGDDLGEEALMKLLAAPSGRFRMWFGPVAGASADAAAMPISAALLESLRRRDEARRASA